MVYLCINLKLKISLSISYLGIIKNKLFIIVNGRQQTRSINHFRKKENKYKNNNDEKSTNDTDFAR